jgi:hypothetical protein
MRGLLRSITCQQDVVDPLNVLVRVAPAAPRQPQSNRVLPLLSEDRSESVLSVAGYFPKCLSKKRAISSNASLVSGAVLLRM